MAFDPKKHTIRVQGNREYLPVSARLVWFRAEHPDWGILTQPVEINLEKQYAIFSATIMNAEGKVMATATKMENVRGFPDYIEKAETGSVGRALAMCGYGTQFAPEFEEGGRFADAPQGPSAGYGGGNRFAGSSNNGPARMGGGNGNGGGNYGQQNRPAPMGMNNRPAAPAPPPPPIDMDDEAEDVFAEDDAPAAPPAAARPAAAATARPATPGAGITRVKEPERDLPDPGGPDDEDEDPFAEDDEPIAAPAAARPTAPPARAAAARANSGASPAAGSGEAITGNRCSVDGCPATLTQGQITMSMNKFGKPLCPLHQRDATPVAAGAGTGGGSRRGAPKPEPADTLL